MRLAAKQSATMVKFGKDAGVKTYHCKWVIAVAARRTCYL